MESEAPGRLSMDLVGQQVTKDTLITKRIGEQIVDDLVPEGLTECVEVGKFDITRTSPTTV